MNEILQQAYDEHVEAANAYLDAEKKLLSEGNGFLSKEALDRVNEKKRDWQEKTNNFYTLLSKGN